jgi:hypothetical protein
MTTVYGAITVARPCRSNDKMLPKNYKRQDGTLYPAAILSNSLQSRSNLLQSKKEGERRAMARTDLGYLPTENPCAQCGKPIAAPEWIENGPHRTSYLWRCSACDYEFEAVAFFADSESTSEPLAA